MMKSDLAQFHLVFFEEAAEHLDAMEQLLVGLNVDAPDQDDLNAIFRAAHSIKGGAGTFGFNDLAGVTHILETLLDKIRNHEFALCSEMIDVFLRAADVLRAQLSSHLDGTMADPRDAAAIVARLETLAAAPGLEIAAASPETPSMHGRGGEAAPESTPKPTLSDDPGFGFFADAPGIPSSADPGYGFFEPLPAPGPEGATAVAPSEGRTGGAARQTDEHRATVRDGEKTASGDSSIRVSIEKVDQMINLVGELVITQAMLAQTVADLDPALNERLMNGMGQLERNTRDLQESVMSVRMTPMSFVFNRFPRVVRDLAGKLGKEVELITEGEGTELDKGLIEKIVDPLTHLVRNSLDHGIEAPEQRLAAGKARKGTVVLRAAHKGGNILIEIEDDGAGLNRERILAKACERGLPAAETTSDADVWQLIFAPGFSTAEEVTDVSGRGVGMDVVKRNIDALGGRVEINSEAGFGTKVAIQLPLTLAILDGMSVAVGREVFIIPLTYIAESMQPAAEDIRTVSGQGQVVHVRGEYLPLVTLYRLFNLVPRTVDPAQGILVIVETGAGRIALFVDELVGQHQVVIKSLEANYRKVAGIAGATIMGDGRVALIFDVAAVARMAQS